jgi:hypothetical protein
MTRIGKRSLLLSFKKDPPRSGKKKDPPRSGKKQDPPRSGKKQESSFSEEKEAKRLLTI